VRTMAGGRGYPLLLMDHYAKGTFYVWTLPDNFNDLYRMPASVLSAIKSYIMTGFPVKLDGPSQVALFAYDNNTFITESYLPKEADVRVSVLGGATKLRNLVTGETLTPQAAASGGGFGGGGRGGRGGRGGGGEQRTTFVVHLLPHSYAVFAAEN